MKDKIITFIFVGYLVIFSLLHIIIQDKEISNSERRVLATFPRYDVSNEYVVKVEKYLLDHFPFRNRFRGIKAYFNYNILKKLDNNGIYLKDNFIYKSNYPTNKDSICNFRDKIHQMTGMLNENNSVYFMIIPDKNYYLNDSNFLQINYDYIYFEFQKENDFYHIDIRDIMEMNDYYETDTHWKQERLDKVVRKMSTVMNFHYQKFLYEEKIYDKFYGVYYGESAINRSPEVLKYLINEELESVKVRYLENDKLVSIYNLEKLNSLDAYEVYLDGASSFIEITNFNSESDKELVIFRDSFASSITPLLVPFYKKITLIDNRYISSGNYLDLIEFYDQDVLFMYSTLIINNSGSLKG